jgi:two-component system sensor histidine kinase/response regulator
MAQVSNQNMTGAAAKTGGVRPNILIVDDRRENLLATEKILRHLEADIFKANSGNEALSLLLRHRFALVLLDVQMPDMDGFETAMLMQEHESMRGVPIIFVTAISKEERYATRAAEIGAVDYIFKPINSEILRSKVKVYLDLYVQREELFTIQSALGDAEARLRAILDNVLDGIITIDGNGTVISINPAVVKMFGYEAAEVIEHNIRMLMPEPNRGNHDGYLARYESTGKTRAIGIGRELEGLTKQGITFPMELTVTEVAFQGQRMFVGLVRDITERKRSEDASRRARAAAEVANRTKSDFLANMSHEIRTPMNAIMGMTYLALRAAPSPQQHGYLTKIGHAAQSLLGIMNDILDFSKIEAGKLEMEHIAFSLDEVLLRNLVDIVGQKAEEKGIALEFSVAQETPRFLIGDPLRLGQVLINLVNNAIKFTDQGKILVKVQADERTLDRVRLQFSVSDTGIGISPDQMENLFQSFNQGDSSFTRKYGGTGLGLAISKQLCELMGGSIAAESELGKGSIFRFTADFGIAGDELPRVARESRGPSLTRNVLIVDDSESARSVLLAMLQANSFLARAVSSGEEALSALTRGSQVGHPFDLVLMDWRLPGIDGIEASRRIKEHPTLSPIPAILMISAFESEEVLNGLSDPRFDGFLVKPVAEQLLMRTIASIRAERADGPAPAIPSAPGYVPPELSGRHVLVVEDNEINQDLASELLGDLGIRVAIADNGRAGVDQVCTEAFDLVLMDIQMPVMDGLTATKLIRSKERFRQLPIIAMTAHAMRGDRERSLDAGMNDHLTKPINPESLTATLLRWIPAQAARPCERAGDAVNPGWSAEELPAQLPPFDIQAALARTNGKTKLLRKMLRGFCEQYTHAAFDLRVQFREGRVEEAHRLAHSLKGIAATLEARELAEAAGALAQALREGQMEGLGARITTLEEALVPAITAASSLDFLRVPSREDPRDYIPPSGLP